MSTVGERLLVALRTYLDGWVEWQDLGATERQALIDGLVTGYETTLAEDCPTCGEPHREWEHEWVFTFAAQHRHPTTGEPLQWCYVAVAGSAESAREQMVRLFATGWARQYPSREHAGVDRYGLTEIPWPAGDRGGTS